MGPRSRKRFSEPDRVLLWDLDGTIVDTSRDLASAVNRMLAEYGYPPLSTPVVVGHVGKGAQNLVARCLEEYGHALLADSVGPGTVPPSSAPRPESTVAAALAMFERHYVAHLIDETVVYPGVAALLHDLAASGRDMAVVSNKPEAPSREILRRFGLTACFRTVIGGETLPMRKPAPEPLWHAIQSCRGARLAVEPERALMIGDTSIDAEAARAAGVPVALVAWGLGDRETARSSHPDVWVESAEELREILL